jgi:hypothetical protein
MHDAIWKDLTHLMRVYSPNVEMVNYPAWPRFYRAGGWLILWPVAYCRELDIGAVPPVFIVSRGEHPSSSVLS